MDLAGAHLAALYFWADYTDAVDRRAFDSLAGLLGDADVHLPGSAGPLRGGAAVARRYRDVLAPEPDGHHLISNPRVRADTDGTAMTAECRYHYVDGRTLTVRVLGRYRTRFVRREEGWRPVRHEIVRDFASPAATPLAATDAN
ncbi:nuclear transport factor 2 family protein [Streptomyces sp. NPDC090994]|uniref:nuclear transport factor 2 family protein n=1 Tax=Streptomyces sp. NPDC090994 TaxID=3365969 RepID=UPI00381997AC